MRIYSGTSKDIFLKCYSNGKYNQMRFPQLESCPLYVDFFTQRKEKIPVARLFANKLANKDSPLILSGKEDQEELIPTIEGGKRLYSIRGCQMNIDKLFIIHEDYKDDFNVKGLEGLIEINHIIFYKTEGAGIVPKK